MMPAFTPVDGVLWALAVVLAGAALWLSAPRSARWDIAEFFAVAWAVGSRPDPCPLTGGPAARPGWTGSPEGLAEEADPVRRLGMGCTWDAVAEWRPEVEAAIARKMTGTSVVWFEEPVVDLGPVVRLPPPAEAHDRLDALLERPSARVVLVASTQGQALLELLHELPGLRDRVRMVLLVGAAPDAEWVARELRHETFHLELAHAVPYCTLRTAPGQVLRTPDAPPTGRIAIDVVDLGRVEAEDLGRPALTRALRVVIAAVVGA